MKKLSSEEMVVKGVEDKICALLGDACGHLERIKKSSYELTIFTGNEFWKVTIEPADPLEGWEDE